MFLLLLAGPCLALLALFYFTTNVFYATKTADVFEGQMQLLNSAGLLLDKADAKVLPQKAKSLLGLSGMENLVMFDKSGIMRYSNKDAWTGKPLAEVFGAETLDRVTSAKLQEGNFEVSPQGGDRLLVSYLVVDLVYDRMTLMLFKSRSIALRPQILFTFKAGSALAAIVGFFIFATAFVFGARKAEGKGDA